MNSTEFLVQVLSPHEWTRWRNLRLASLEFDAHAFGSNYELEASWTNEDWMNKVSVFAPVVASQGSLDVAMMSVENLSGDFGATCWIGGCWVRPEYRNRGVLRTLFEYLDSQATSRDWSVQGLGVWEDNVAAIAAYEQLGFANRGEPMPSSRQPGKFYQRMIRQTR